MKLTLKVKTVGTITGWIEEYDSDEVTDPSSMNRRRTSAMSVSTQEDAEKWGRDIVDSYNAGVRQGQMKREFISVTLTEETGASK